VIAARMEDAKNNDPVALKSVENLIGKTRRQDSAKSAIIIRMPLRVPAQGLDRDSNVCQEFVPKTWSLILIPIPGLSQISLRPGADEDAPFHAPLFLQSRLYFFPTRPRVGIPGIVFQFGVEQFFFGIGRFGAATQQFLLFELPNPVANFPKLA
jgi:hypothetical protein